MILKVVTFKVNITVNNTVRNIIQWFNINQADIIVLTVIAAAVALAIKKLIKDKKTGCQGKCIGCSAAHFCNHNSNSHTDSIIDSYHQTYPKN